MSKDHIIWLEQGWQPVAIGVCLSREAWDHYMQEIGMEGEPFPLSGPACMTTFENSNTGGVTCIMTFSFDGKKKGPLPIIGLVAHEALHVIDACVSEMGEKSEAREFRAYGLQSIVQQTLKVLIDHYGMKLKWR